MTTVTRHWCAKCHYDGRKEFMLGTVQAEGEMHALQMLAALWSKVSPHPPPKMIALPGLLAFVGDDD